MKEQLEQILIDHALFPDATERGHWITRFLGMRTEERRWQIKALLMRNNKVDGGGNLDQTIINRLDVFAAEAGPSPAAEPKKSAPKKLSVKQKALLAPELKDVIFSADIATVIQTVVTALEPVLNRVVTYADVDDLLAWFPSLNNSPIRQYIGEKDKTEVVSQAGRELFIMLDAFLREARKNPQIHREGGLEFQYFSDDYPVQRSVNRRKIKKLI